MADASVRGITFREGPTKAVSCVWSEALRTARALFISQIFCQEHVDPLGLRADLGTLRVDLRAEPPRWVRDSTKRHEDRSEHCDRRPGPLPSS